MLNMDAFHTGTAQKVDSVGETVKVVEYDTANTGLNNKLGALEARRRSDIQRRAFAAA